MNFLAHFQLSNQQEGLILGNLAADAVRGDDWKNYPPDIAEGIHQHRAIDFFTDTHPLTSVLKQQIRPFAGRFAGPVSDIVRDHFLSECWSEFSEKTIPDFSEKIYEVLTRRWQELPPRLHDRAQNLVKFRWLTTYQTLAGLEDVLHRFQPRLAPNRLEIKGLLQFLETEKPTLLADFRAFYPELKTAVEKFHAPQPLENLQN